jgi:hypothetical protein
MLKNEVANFKLPSNKYISKKKKSSNLRTPFGVKNTLLKGILKILNRKHFTAIFANSRKRMENAIVGSVNFQ